MLKYCMLQITGNKTTQDKKKKKTVKEPVCNMATQGNTATSVFNTWELQPEWPYDIFRDLF